jgi:integrase
MTETGLVGERSAGLAQASPGCVFGGRVSGGKSELVAGSAVGASSQIPHCPECHSSKLWRDGQRYPMFGDAIQRWLCRECGHRFSDPKGAEAALKALERDRSLETKTLKSDLNISSGRQICVSETKNLDRQTEIKTVGVEERQKLSPEALIVNYLISLKNNGRRDSTLEARNSQLNRLVNLGADLNDPESVKKVVASLDRSESYKALLCIAYDGFAEKNGFAWTRPDYKQCDKLPFVPHESEIDALIAGCGKKTATFLKMLKETAMRPGEAWQVEWIDFDLANRTLICKYPEKNSRSRAFDDLSPELCQMLISLPHNSQYIFSCNKIQLTKEDRKMHMQHLKRQKGLLGKQRHRIALKLKNPRINKISYCSCRHYKATQLYHQTKDILYVMKFLGHRSIKNTLVYIDLEKISYPHGGDDYTAKLAKTEVEALQLVEAGFEYVCSMGESKIFRKRK